MRDWLPLSSFGAIQLPGAEFHGLKSLEKIISTFTNCQGKMDGGNVKIGKRRQHRKDKLFM
jgi:hypothetical protein